MSAARLLPSLRELRTCLSEADHLERLDLRHVLFSLGFSPGYTDDLAEEAQKSLGRRAHRSGARTGYNREWHEKRPLGQA